MKTQLTADQFYVTEYYSYDIIGTIVYALILDSHRSNVSKSRMIFFTELTNSIGKCRQRVFPDYRFDASEFAKR